MHMRILPEKSSDGELIFVSLLVPSPFQRQCPYPSIIRAYVSIPTRRTDKSLLPPSCPVKNESGEKELRA